MNENLGPFASIALRLHEMGLAPIPCGGPKGKKPLIERWQRNRLSPKRIAALAAQYADANVGIVCGLSGVVIVDIDRAELLEAMLQRFGGTPLIIRTSRGYHLWYRQGAPVKATKLQGLPVEILAGNKFVVVPPSRHPSGVSYAFERGSWDDFVRLPEFRAGAVGRKTQRAPQPGAPRSIDPVAHAGQRRDTRDASGVICEGQRNCTLHRTCLELVRRTKTFEELLARAHAINRERNRPPLPDSEVEQTARSAWQCQREGRNWVGSSGVVQLEVDTTLGAAGPLERGGDAVLLCMLLQREHACRTEPFAVSPRAMARHGCIPGWSEHRYRRALKAALEVGFLRMIKQGGRGPGDVSLYELGESFGRKGRPVAELRTQEMW